MKTFITNQIAVLKSSIKVLANNGETADQKITLERAKIVDGGVAYYLNTNGDPVPVALIDVDGELLWGRDGFGGIASDNLPWLADEEHWLSTAKDKRFVAALSERLAD